MEPIKIILLIAGVLVIVIILARLYADLSADYSDEAARELTLFEYEPPEPAPRCLEQESLQNLQNACCGACEAGCEDSAAVRCKANP